MASNPRGGREWETLLFPSSPITLLHCLLLSPDSGFKQFAASSPGTRANSQAVRHQGGPQRVGMSRNAQIIRTDRNDDIFRGIADLRVVCVAREFPRQDGQLCEHQFGLSAQTFRTGAYQPDMLFLGDEDAQCDSFAPSQLLPHPSYPVSGPPIVTQPVPSGHAAPIALESGATTPDSRFGERVPEAVSTTLGPSQRGSGRDADPAGEARLGGSGGSAVLWMAWRPPGWMRLGLRPPAKFETVSRDWRRVIEPVHVSAKPRAFSRNG